MKTLLFFVSMCLAVGLRAESPRPDGMTFFKQSVGSWNGKGTSVVGPNKSKLEVTDDWKGEFADGGNAFVQTGKVTLSNGSSFDYRWIYKVDPKNGKLMGLYADSHQTRTLFSVQLAEDQSKLSVVPLNAAGTPSITGVFCTLYFKDGRLLYDAEVRDEGGKPFIQTTVACVKQDAKSAPSP